MPSNRTSWQRVVIVTSQKTAVLNAPTSVLSRSCTLHALATDSYEDSSCVFTMLCIFKKSSLKNVRNNVLTNWTNIGLLPGV